MVAPELHDQMEGKGPSFGRCCALDGLHDAKAVAARLGIPHYVVSLERSFHKLTLEAQARVAQSPLSKREVARRLGTPAAQLYRLLDQTNGAKSIDQVLNLLRG